jgi:hypothetical protein
MALPPDPQCVDPVRRDGAVHFVDLERALLVGKQIFELLIRTMQVYFEGLAQEQEWIEPDVRLAFGTHRDEVAQLLLAHESAQRFFGDVGVVVVENHVRILVAAPHARQSHPARNVSH